MSVYYLDTSAAMKLLVEETHSQAFAGFYDDHRDDVWVSSSLLRVEMIRAVRRAVPELLPQAEELLSAFAWVAVSDEIVHAAEAEPDVRLRTLDAIHLATARVLGSELSGLVTYDDGLAVAADEAGVTSIRPITLSR